jgi:hypothetical protein
MPVVVLQRMMRLNMQQVCSKHVLDEIACKFTKQMLGIVRTMLQHIHSFSVPPGKIASLSASCST